MSAEQNKARVLELVQRVLNGHDIEALDEFTSNPAVLGSGQRLLHAFPDLEAHVRWIIAEGDMVVVFFDMRGTQQGALVGRPGIDRTPRRQRTHACSAV